MTYQIEFDEQIRKVLAMLNSPSLDEEEGERLFWYYKKVKQIEKIYQSPVLFSQN